MELFVSLDFFGGYLHWYVNHQKKIYTRLGGILTTLSFIICFAISTFFFRNFIKRGNPILTENNFISKKLKKIKFGEEKIYIPWTISDYRSNKINFTGYLYPIIYYFYGERDNKTNVMQYNYKLINYTFCNKTNLKSINYFTGNNYIDLNSLYCIDMDDLIIGGDWFHDFIYHIQMDIFLCEDGVNFGTEGKKCTNDTNFTKIIGKNNAWHIEIYYPEIQFKPLNKNEPIQIFYNTHFYNFNKLNIKVERFFFKEYIMIDDQGWLLEKDKKSTFWGFEKIDSDTYSISENGKDFITDFSSSKIYSLVFYVSRNEKIFTRKYTKLLDGLGNMISIINGIFIFFKFISQFFTEAYQDREIVANIFVQKYEMDEKFRKISESRKMKIKDLYSDNLHKKKRKTMDEKIIPAKPIKSLDNINNINCFNKQNNINKSKSGANNKEVKFPPNADKALEKIKHLQNRNLFQFNIDSAPENLQISQNNCFALNNIDNSNFVFSNPQNNLFLHEVKKDKNNINKKKLNRNYFSIDVNKNVPLNKTRFFRFSYYLYLLNMFNKIFSTSKMCCVNKNFLDVWNNVTNIIDVNKYFELQTNVDLINKILFELKIDGEKDDVKCSILNNEDANKH